MLTEYRTWLTVVSPSPRPTSDWEDLLTELTKSPETRGPVMKVRGAPAAPEADFTVSYPATDQDAAGRDATVYLEAAILALGWPACNITVDQVDEVDLEKELQEGRL